MLLTFWAIKKKVCIKQENQQLQMTGLEGWITSGMCVYCCAINGFKMYNCDLMIQDEVLRDNHRLNDIRNSSYSPYQLKVRPRVEPDQVKVEGPGVSGKGIPASLPAEFTIDTTQAGYGDLEVQVKVSYWQTCVVCIWNLHNLHTHEIQLFNVFSSFSHPCVRLCLGKIFRLLFKDFDLWCLYYTVHFLYRTFSVCTSLHLSELLKVIHSFRVLMVIHGKWSWQTMVMEHLKQRTFLTIVGGTKLASSTVEKKCHTLHSKFRHLQRAVWVILLPFMHESILLWRLMLSVLVNPCRMNAGMRCGICQPRPGILVLCLVLYREF